jgi:hypothetical protein
VDSKQLHASSLSPCPLTCRPVVLWSVVVRSGVGRTLVLGGSRPSRADPNRPSILLVEDWVKAWRLVDAPVTNLGLCSTTHDEAVAMKALSAREGWHKLILVTSALHLRRSVALFRKLPIEITPVAADFEVWGVPQDSRFSLIPRQCGFYLMQLYLHEKIGMAWYRVRGWA